MIPSKLRAYNQTNEGWEIVNRWDLIKMSQVEYDKFKELNFPLYLKKNKESYKLTFNRGQKTFRFYPGEIPDDKKGSPGLTISHQIAQEVISDLRTLNLKLTDKRFKPYKKVDFRIEVDQIFEEFRTTANDNEYIVDLLIVFSKPEWLALKWNRTLALEVFVTHDVEGKKIIDFEKKRVSLAEIVIGSKLKLKKSAAEVTETEENELRQVMKHAFNKQIFGDLLVDTTSTKYLENATIQELLAKNSSLDKRIQGIQGQMNEMVSRSKLKEEHISKLNTIVKRIESQLREKVKKNAQLQKELNGWMNKSKFQRLVDLIKR